MRSHKILDHTADVRMKVEGSTLAELFSAALESMAEIIKHNALKAPVKALNIKEKINVKSGDKTLLLIDFLSEVLTRAQIKKCVFTKVKFEELNETGLVAEVFGEKADTFEEDVKAVTYHEAKIVKNKKRNFETVIIFDI